MGGNSLKILESDINSSWEWGLKLSKRFDRN
jgi:hypothetical protein